MRLYVKAYSSYKGDLNNFDLKKELKQNYKYDTRRQDRFIYLALYGALRLKETIQIGIDNELYITSGIGNIEVIQKSNLLVNENKEYLKPFDFINMLGNTTSYYVAKALGVKSKNIFEISNHFTYINTLISLYASIKISKKDAILGAVDLVTEPESLTKRVLGIKEDIKLLSASNYQKLSLSKENALAYIEFDTEIYSLNKIKKLLKRVENFQVIAPECKELNQENPKEHFETSISQYINNAIENRKNILYISSFHDRYKVVKVVNSI